MRTLFSAFVVLALLTSGCGEEPEPPSTDADAVRARAITTQTAQHRTGAELQASALNRVVRTVYLCQNGDRLSVDFDNPRRMATVRNSSGEAVDLFQEQAGNGIWYRASAYELRGVGRLATWSADGRPPTECRAID